MLHCLARDLEDNMDSHVTIQVLKKAVDKLVKDRNWDQFHSLKNLAINLSVESSELLEHFTWHNQPWSDIPEKKQKEIQDELADVLINVILFANNAHIDLSSALSTKLKKIEEKYPVHLAYGSNKKYTDYVQDK